MPKFEVCLIETREYFFEVEAEDEAEAESIAADLDPEESNRDTFRELSFDWVRKIED